MPTEGDDLGSHAVTVLIGCACFGVPAAAVKRVKFRTSCAEFRRVFSRCGHKAQWDRTVHAGNDVDFAALRVIDNPRGIVAQLRIDEVDVTVGRFGDVESAEIGVFGMVGNSNSNSM